MKELLKELIKKANKVKNMEEDGKQNFLDICKFICVLLDKEKLWLATEYHPQGYPITDIAYDFDSNKVKKYEYCEYEFGREIGTYYITRNRIVWLMEKLQHRIEDEIEKLNKQEKAYKKLSEIVEIIKS